MMKHWQMSINSSETVLKELNVTREKKMENWQMSINSSETVLKELNVTR
jgi:hypothetical protein